MAALQKSLLAIGQLGDRTQFSLFKNYALGDLLFGLKFENLDIKEWFANLKSSSLKFVKFQLLALEGIESKFGCQTDWVAQNPFASKIPH